MQKKVYRGGITCEQFLFYEMRLVARESCEIQDWDKIFERILKCNLFQYPTERSVRRIAITCHRRLEGLESKALVQALANASISAAKQINLYAMMLDNAIVWDFMTQVIGEKFRTQAYSYSQKDFNLFWLELQSAVPAAQKWSESTIQKIRQVLNKVLVECEYLDHTKADHLNPVFLYPELEQEIRRKQDAELLAAFHTFQ